MVHAALNEAADNVLSWAYENGESSLPPAARRWWTLGMLRSDQQSVFMALDHGATIPATAPRSLGEELQAALRELLRSGRLRAEPARSDANALQATISLKRTQSRKGERGKGLASMIALIDRLETGEIVIISGNAIYGYRGGRLNRPAQESSRPLGWRFEGTMIMWFVGGSSRLDG